MRGGTGRIRAAIMAAGLLACLVPPAAAQELEDVLDLSCGPSVEGPVAGPGSHAVSVTGAYGCGSAQPSIGVIVCLEYNGIAMRCGQDTRVNDVIAEASVSFPCLPGLWTATAAGVATGGPPGGAAGVAVPVECDPLR
jgi:hypothetical protein